MTHPAPGFSLEGHALSGLQSINWMRFGELILASLLALDRPFQGLIERCLRLFVLLLSDASLLVLNLELEELFLESFQQHGWPPTSTGRTVGRSRSGPRSIDS